MTLKSYFPPDYLSRLTRPTITKKIGLLFLIPILGAAVSLGTFINLFSQTSYGPHFINAAGRQRMLAQQILVYAGMVTSGQEDDRALLNGAITTFDHSLYVLENGGWLLDFKLPPAPLAVREEIDNSKRIWNGLKNDLLIIAAAEPGDPDAVKAYLKATREIPQLTQASNNIVKTFIAFTDSLRRQTARYQAAIAGFDVILFLFGLWFTRRYISRPVVLLEEAAQHIKAGDFSHRVPIITRDEMSTLSETFNDMSEHLEQLIAERERTRVQLEYSANRDPLTSLYNRRHFQEELAGQLDKALQYDTQGAVFFIDLDNFKFVNDKLGHQAGDELLRNMAGTLQKNLRKTDTIARLGGDEFAVILPDIDQEQAASVATQLLRAVRNKVLAGGRPVEVTASIGIALFPQHGVTVDEVLVNADSAMYMSKERGRNRYSIFNGDEKEQKKAETDPIWVTRIREALEDDRLTLHLQGIFDLELNTVSRYEALVRLIDKSGELIMPGDFIRAAERFGLINEIDRWVTRRAIQLIHEFEHEGIDLCLEVNLSAQAMSDPELLPLIRRELNETMINPANLIFEITETAAIANLAEADRFIQDLRKVGCQFALDDFGVGFSSFNHLKHLNVDYLKIDGSFIRDLPRNNVDKHLVRGMVEVAKGLGKKTIAEFVTDRETMELVRELGVDYAQGYCIGKPCPVNNALMNGKPEQALCLFPRCILA